MAYDPLHKGSRGVDYRTKIGLHRASSTTMPEYAGSSIDPLWDIYIGPLPFLLANNKERPYLRESVPARRERLDQAREPGENSLDSGIWLRSQTSWHLGAGQRYAEPLEEDPDIARFRFNQSGGVDPWEAGEISLLPDVTERDTGARHCIGIPNGGVVVSSESNGVQKYLTSGDSVELSTKVVTKLTASNAYWYGLGANRLEYGLINTGGEDGLDVTNPTALHWGKDRLWLAAAGACYEFTTVNPTALPTAHYTFKSGTVVDIDSGAGGVYWLVNDAFSSVYVSTVKDDGSLNPPREVAKLPRGETGNFLYCYLDRYLVIGTDKGVRVADAGDTATLPVGPLIVELEGGCMDATGNGNYIWFTGGTTGVTPSPDGVAVPGLYRMYLGTQISSTSAYGDTAAARYPYAADLAASGTGQAWSVTTYEDKIFFVAGESPNSSSLWQQGTGKVPGGWVESGQISFSTSEQKAWSSFSLEVQGDGTIYMTADSGAGFAQVTQTAVAVPYTGDQNIDGDSHPVSGWIQHRVQLIGDGTEDGSPILQSIGLRALPAPKRTRRVQVPLLCYDHWTDRNNNPVGYEGFGYDRLKDLEALEQAGGLINAIDNRTGETIKCQIERVQYEGLTPPDRANINFGGTVTVTLLTV